MRYRRRARNAVTATVAAAVFAASFITVGLASAQSDPAHLAPSSGAPLSSGAAPARGAVAAAVSTRLSFRLPEVNGETYTPNARNIAMRSTAGGPLLLFLPATRAVPRDYRSFLDTAESSGYHVLALDYWNIGLSVAQTCGARPNCYGSVQANRFDGSHPTRFSAIEKSDSILARLTHALTMLAVRDPGGVWGEYLDNGRVRWDRIVVAGHSQGGGESAYIAHRHRVQGVLLFASPVATDGRIVASWLTRPGATPSSRYYGFDSRGDMYFDRIQGSWNAMRLGGPQRPTAITDTVPLGAGRRLVTSVALGSPAQSHNRLINDAGPRTATGAPAFRPIWLWMLGAVRAPTASF